MDRGHVVSHTSKESAQCIHSRLTPSPPQLQGRGSKSCNENIMIEQAAVDSMPIIKESVRY